MITSKLVLIELEEYCKKHEITLESLVERVMLDFINGRLMEVERKDLYLC